MSCYLFQNGSVYVLIDGRPECVPRDEFMASGCVEDKNAHILIAEADGLLFMEHVRQIRQMFPLRGIKTCVSYAAALRTFLQMRGLIATGESCLAADDLGDKFLLTASDGHQKAVTRAILSRDPQKIVDEIRRTQKSVMEKEGLTSREPVFRILSNNADVIEALDPERKKEARLFETSFPVFEVLGKVKFPVQLMPPEELVLQKQGVLRRGLIAALAVALLLAGLGTLCFLWARERENAAVEKVSGLMREKVELDREAQGISVLTYQDQIKALPRAAFLEVFDQFLRSLPPGGNVEHVFLERRMDDRWSFTGLVSFPRQEVLPLFQDGIFKNAKIEHVFLQTKPAMKITLMPLDEGKGGSLP
jgi:hypothetical protein